MKKTVRDLKRGDIAEIAGDMRTVMLVKKSRRRQGWYEIQFTPPTQRGAHATDLRGDDEVNAQ